MLIFRCDCVLTWMPLKKQDKPACERKDWDVDVCVCVRMCHPFTVAHTLDGVKVLATLFIHDD